MAMIRHRVATASRAPVTLLYSSRSLEDVIYRDELLPGSRDDGVEVLHTLTREQPPDWTGFSRRVDREMLSAVAARAGAQPRVYVCGPTGFVETVADLLVGLGHEPGAIRTERFGATG